MLCVCATWNVALHPSYVVYDFIFLHFILKFFFNLYYFGHFSGKNFLWNAFTISKKGFRNFNLSNFSVQKYPRPSTHLKMFRTDLRSFTLRLEMWNLFKRPQILPDNKRTACWFMIPKKSHFNKKRSEIKVINVFQ